MPLTSFDVTKYLNGHPVQTRDGRSISNLKQITFAGLSDYYLSAVVDLKPIVWNISGVRDYINGTPDGLDLFMKDIPGAYKYVLTSNIINTAPGSLVGYSIIQIVDLT